MLNHLKTEEHQRISESNLTDIFYSGIKSEEIVSQKNVGIEFEKLPVKNSDYRAVPYYDIARFLQEYKKIFGISITENNAILGIDGDIGTITLEPGSQTEISLNPISNLLQAKKTLDNYNQKTAMIAKKLGFCWLGCGIQPVSTYRTINIIPKKRYVYMTKYLPAVAKKPLIMMRETAGIQASVDYLSEEDAMKKFAFALKLSPIVSAMFSNSPIRNGRLTKFKSNRAASWLDTDNDRCGLVSAKVFSGEFSFEDYVQILLDVPMIFIEREINGIKTAIKIENMTFRQFLKNGYESFYATEKDWENHLSLYFSDVRFKNYIEIRNHDSQRADLICAVPALWKGLIYNSYAMSDINDILKKFTYFDIAYLRRKVPQVGLNIKIKNYKLYEIAKEIADIAYQSLKEFGLGEEILLDELKTLLSKNLTPADIIINKWSDSKNNISKFVEYSILK